MRLISKLKISLTILVIICLQTVLFGQRAQYSQKNLVSGTGQTGDIRVHDPVLTMEDGTYYVFHTGRGVSIKKSKDRSTWEREGSVFGREELPEWHQADIPEQKGHLWAPDIHYRDGKFHCYYSVSAWMNFNSSIGYASNTTLDRDDPEYLWIDHGKVIDFQNGGEGVNVIDPQVFVDEDNRVFIFYGSYQAGLRMVELDPLTGMLFSETPELSMITPRLGEGVFVIEGHGYFYIFASRGICCKGLESNYQVVMGRSKKLTGPYLNKKGESWLDNKYSLLLAGDEAEPGRGHNGFFEENDTTFIIYHAYSRSAEGASLMNIKPLFLDEDLWPTLDETGVLFDCVSLDRVMKPD